MALLTALQKSEILLLHEDLLPATCTFQFKHVVLVEKYRSLTTALVLPALLSDRVTCPLDPLSLLILGI